MARLTSLGSPTLRLCSFLSGLRVCVGSAVWSAKTLPRRTRLDLSFDAIELRTGAKPAGLAPDGVNRHPEPALSMEQAVELASGQCGGTAISARRSSKDLRRLRAHRRQLARTGDPALGGSTVKRFARASGCRRTAATRRGPFTRQQNRGDPRSPCAGVSRAWPEGRAQQVSGAGVVETPCSNAAARCAAMAWR